MRDVEQEFVDSGFETIDDSLDSMVDGDELSEADAGDARDRVTGTTDLGDMADCDIVVEAVVENMDVKQDVFADLEAVTDEDAILATNTSRLSITTIASATDRPEKVVGVHFMNPVPVMKGVEVVGGEKTADGVVGLAHDFLEDLGKENLGVRRQTRVRHEPGPDAVDQRGHPGARRGRRHQGGP